MVPACAQKLSPMTIAVLVPCYNEEAAIATVVRDFKAALPDATIYVYDNNSSDQTVARARQAGAVVRLEARQGKGNVVRRMFADVDADIYVLVDGDDTYDASAAAGNMVRGGQGQRRRHPDRPADTHRNRRLSARSCFRQPAADRADGPAVQCAAVRHAERLPRLLAALCQSFPFTAEGFGIETELTVHAVRLMMPMIEMDTRYKERPVGSVSKLNTWRDGFRILSTIGYLVREERPLIFFSAFFVLLASVSLLTGAPVVSEYPAYRPGAAPAHCSSGHRLDGAGLPGADVRLDPGYRHARPLGAKAHGLSGDSRRPQDPA